MKTLALASALILFPLVSSAQEHPTDPKWNALARLLGARGRKRARWFDSPEPITPNTAAIFHCIAATDLRRALGQRRHVDNARRESGSD